MGFTGILMALFSLGITVAMFYGIYKLIKKLIWGSRYW